VQQVKNIPCRVAGSQYHGVGIDGIAVVGNYAGAFIIIDQEIRYFLAKQYLAAALPDLIPNRHDDVWQLVGANVRVGFVQNLFIGTKMYQYGKDALNVAPLVAAGVQLAIAVGACAAFAKTVIAFLIYYAFLVHGCKVAPAAAHIFAALQHNWF